MKILKVIIKSLNIAIFCNLILHAGNLFSQSSPQGISDGAASLYASAQVKMVLQKGLAYLQATQKKETKGIDYFAGEWGSFEKLDRYVPKFGLKAGYQAYDSNCFTTASISFSLAEIYDKYPQYQEILSMLRLAAENIQRYRTEDYFYFWQKLPFPENLLRKGEAVRDYPQFRRGNHFHLARRSFLWASNVAPDADDTSLGYLALFRIQRIFDNEAISLDLKLLDKIGGLFSDYRDVNRKNISTYNLITNRRINTGAFMTWLQKEKTFRPWGFLPQPEKPNIMLGSNDVDCVVNTNVLSALATFGELESTTGSQQACRFVNWAINKHKNWTCGVYYPNRYNLHYTAARAYASGAKCLEPSAKMIKSYVLRTQNPMGYWSSKYLRNRLQATAYALAALVKVLPAPNEKEMAQMKAAVAYILSQKQEKEGQIFWKAGVFFSGGRIFRRKVSFYSDAYTTAIILEALAGYLKLLENEGP